MTYCEQTTYTRPTRDGTQDKLATAKAIWMVKNLK